MAVAVTGAHSASASLFSPAGAEPSGGGRITHSGAPGPPERHFPLPVVIGHGVFATVTIVFVVLTALDVRGR